ncbi:MAG: peptidoglycan DD-metalloendopeptidase family protein [Leptospirales bacterium]|nr:peptidoglycan DD-metalloendopeptidase family protein [Leptospirales bacterium]
MHLLSWKTAVSSSLMVLFCLVVAVSLEAKPTPAEEITEALKASDWSRADALLEPYMKEHPDQKWTYTSRAWALRNLKEFRRAQEVADAGLQRWPGDADLRKAAAASLADLAETQSASLAIPTLERALAYLRMDYVLYRLARKQRETGQLSRSIENLEAGASEFPQYPHFREVLPYTRYLLFKEQKDPAAIQSFVEKSVDWIDPKKSLQEQQHYLMIINSGMRQLSDRKRFDEIYNRLFSRLPDNAEIYDSYGFALYANFRLHGKKNDPLREEAISARRKALSLFWAKNPRPQPLMDLSFPLRGRYAVWSEFGGSAMTHNGFANYCYDFAAVDAKGEISRSPGDTLQDYFMFGKPVYAVADGTVSGVIDGFPDNEPGGYSHEANTITINHKTYYSFYAHMKRGGILVKPDQTVKAGDLLGYVGNSGMSSQPHLHFCIYGQFPEWVTVPFQFKKTRVLSEKGEGRLSDAPYREGETVVFD